jgi:hypothetical protein
MSEHRPEVADVFRTYGDDFLALWERVLSRPQRKAFDDIRTCRTAALGGHVDQCDQCGHCAISLEAVEFIRRFLLHVLPSRFVHIRHFGFLANRKRKEKLALCQSLLPAPRVVTQARANSPDSQDSTSEEQPRRWPVCKTGRLILTLVLTAAACVCLLVPMIADTS